MCRQQQKELGTRGILCDHSDSSSSEQCQTGYSVTSVIILLAGHCRHDHSASYQIVGREREGACDGGEKYFEQLRPTFRTSQ